MYKERIIAIKKLLFEKNIDVGIITKTENKFYLSGFKSSNFFLVLTKEKDYLLTDFRYIELANGKKDLFEIVTLTNDYEIEDFLKEKFIGKKIGLEFSDISHSDFTKYEKVMGKSSLVDMDKAIEKVRLIKEDYEKECIKKAAEIGDNGFTYILDHIKPGVSEIEIVHKLEAFMKEQGAESLSFDTIAVSGIKSSLPHGEPGDKVIEEGDFFTLDFGCKYKGYCSDMTRTVAVGKVSDEQRKVYNVVLAAQIAACNAIKAGILGKEADMIARDIITNAGYGENFGHGLGHSVGLEVHEDPNLNMKCETALLEGMIVTIEPGIYLPNKFGVRIEDLAIVTKDGIINLCKSKKELIIV